MIKAKDIFCKKIRLSIPEFLQIQRKEITLKQLKINKKIEGVIEKMCKNPSNKRAIIIMLTGFLMKLSEFGIKSMTLSNSIGTEMQNMTSLIISCSKISLFCFILLRMGYCVAKVAMDKKCNSFDYVNECMSLTLVATLFSWLYR